MVNSAQNYSKPTRKLLGNSPYSILEFVYKFSCLFTGKEFEVLIDSHGPEHVTQLMQKVISALEHLESLSATRDQEKETIENLRTTISHLEIEDTKKNEEKHRNAKVSN